MQPLVSIIVITRNRPDMVKACLGRLRAQTYKPFEVIVSDSSTDDRTEAVVREFADIAKHVRTHLPLGTMPAARNLGMAQCNGEIVAFLDDDSLAQPDWLAEIVRGYTGPEIGAVGGRVIDDGERRLAAAYARAGLASVVGKVRPDGTFVDNFIAELPEPVFVERLRGCNMSFSREAITAVGPFDENITGTNAFDDTDYCLRVGRAGFLLRFCPRAVVEHIAAPKEAFERSLVDPRTQYYFARNYAYVLLKNQGFRPALLRTIVLTRNAQPARHLAATIWKTARALGAASGGTAAGIVAAAREASQQLRPQAAGTQGHGAHSQRL